MSVDEIQTAQQRRAPKALPLRLPCFLAAALLLTLLSAGILSAANADCPIPLVDRQRFGFVAVSSNWPTDFDYASLKAGWVVDVSYQSHSAPPEGIDRVLLIRVHTGYTVDGAELGPLVDANPGVTWAIGNEPDSIYHDDIWPEEYARVYHDLYTFIKNRDRSSQVSPGGVVQPTPLRLEYLDRVLAAYQERYGQAMPVDVWNIHNAILDEKRGYAGADIPPGIDAEEGVRRTPDDNDNMTIFSGQIWAFRQWMADRGYGGYPLIITEYGVLMYELWYPQFDAERVGAYMDNTFNFMLTVTDTTLGDPNDGYRLVQRWAWFSLDVPPFDPLLHPDGFNGNLFDPDTGLITAHGENFQTHTNSFSPLSYVDLGFGAWDTPLTADLAGATQTITRPVRARIVNLGTADAGGLTVTLEYDGPVNGTVAHWIDNLPRHSAQWVAFDLTDLEAGKYDLTLQIDPDDLVNETRECNNQAVTAILAATNRNFLPLIASRSAGSLLQSSLSATGFEPEHGNQVQPTSAVPGFHEFDVPTANSYPGQLVLDAQGNVWVSERDGNKIARFDPLAESWQQYNIPTGGSQPWGLVLDGAGNLWFAATAANQIGKLEIASGAITEYAIPTANSEPWEVTVDSGGRVWFTQKAGNKIARLDPSTGGVTEYPVPTANAEPTGIAYYRDVVNGDKIWFTESAVSQIGRLKILDGTRREWSLPTADSGPQDIMIVGNEALWLTEKQGNQLALAIPTTQWMITEVPLRTSNSEPYGIAAQGDVARWFTEKAGNRLGRFTGPVPPEEYLLPTANSQPTDIKVDSDGCAWYTAPGINRIGRLCLPVTYQFRYLPLIFKN